MGMIGLAWRIATGPIWILWTGYKGLWWLFGDTHEKPQPAGAGASAGLGVGAAVNPPEDRIQDQKTAFEVVDSSPVPLPLPRRALRAGFAGSLLSSLGLLLACNALGAAGVMSHDRALLAWAWGSAMISVGSIFAVRRVTRADRRKRGVKAVLRGARDSVARACTWAAGKTVGGVRDGVCWGAARATEINGRHGVSQKAGSVFRAAALGARRVWSSIGRPVPAAPKTAP